MDDDDDGVHFDEEVHSIDTIDRSQPSGYPQIVTPILTKAPMFKETPLASPMVEETPLASQNEIQSVLTSDINPPLQSQHAMPPKKTDSSFDPLANRVPGVVLTSSSGLAEPKRPGVDNNQFAYNRPRRNASKKQKPDFFYY